MEKHYQQVVDEIFGLDYSHRTLRTLFDPQSSEWDKTTVEKKIRILKRLLESGKITLPEILKGYKYFYRNEVFNKEHAAEQTEEALMILLGKALGVSR